MTDTPRLNGVIRAFEEGTTAFATFSPMDIDGAVALAASQYDAIVFDFEHNPPDIQALRNCMQYLLDRRQILEKGTLAPAVTPLVRIPPNGREMNQWMAKQVLDIGAFGIVFPHISTVEEARNAVRACRYSRPKASPRYEPAGQRGDGPGKAVRYWGLTQQEYYARADVWPLDPQGEILVIIMVEQVQAIENLPRILKEVAGIGMVLIGEGDLCQDLGHPRQYDHPDVIEAVSTILGICKQHNVPCGHPHADLDAVEHLVQEGYRFLMPSPVRSFAALEKGLQAAGRA